MTYTRLLAFNACIFFAMFAVNVSRNDYLFRCAHCLWGFNFALSLNIFISFAVLYNSPHSSLNQTVAYAKAHKLLTCAHSRIPNLQQEWRAIDECLEKISLYNVSLGRIPFMRSIARFSGPPTAFVYHYMDSKSIFATKEYQSLNLYDKALVLIHECAHLGLGAVDHAYTWEPKYLELTDKEHYENADSFMDAVFYHCN